MGRDSGFDNKEGMKKGMWTAREDHILKDYIKMHGEGKWSKIARATGLKRSGKSLRLRWLNYLRPDIKRGKFAEDEEDLIIRMHKLVGNRWSLIAGRIPGRTDNEIKNYWNSTLKKKVPQKNLLEASRNEIKENLLSSPKAVAVEDDQHLIENNEVGGGGGGMITPISMRCFACNVNVDEDSQRPRHLGNTSTKSTTFSSKVGVAMEAKNDVELAANNLNDDPTWTDLIMDMNGGQFDVTEFFQTDFSKFYESEGTFNFEVGGCSTDEDWLNNI